MSNGTQVASTDGGKSVLARGDDPDTHKISLLRIDLGTSQSKTLWEEDQAPTTDFLVSQDGLRIVFEAEQTNHSNELWIGTTDGSSPKAITNLNPDFQDFALGTGQVVEWSSLRGEKVRGALILPGNYRSGNKYPLVVCVYGDGDRSNEVNTFGVFCGHGVSQLLASRDFAVLTAGGFQRVGTPMADIASDVLPAIDRLSRLGIVAPDKVGLIGHSDGGYDVASLIVQTTRFKAAVIVSGYGDLFGLYGYLQRDGSSYGIARLENGNPSVGKTPWENPLLYVQNSPAYFLDRVQTPVLIVHGASDVPDPAYLSDALFVGLTRLGKRAEYAKYENEGHFPELWSFTHRVDYYTRVVNWFQIHLKDAEPVNQPVESNQYPSGCFPIFVDQ